MTWRVPRPRSDARLVDENGVITFEHQKWLDKLASRTDNGIRVFVPGDRVLPSDWMILVDATAAPLTVDLPPAKESQGRWLTVKKVDFVPANTVTIDAFGAELIDWIATTTLTSTNESKTVVCDGTAWWIQ